jgi:hypothetical protein
MGYRVVAGMVHAELELGEAVWSELWPGVTRSNTIGSVSHGGSKTVSGIIFTTWRLYTVTPDTLVIVNFVILYKSPSDSSDKVLCVQLPQ